MSQILHQRCANHADREAAVLCLRCGRYFCRECVTEHEMQLVCSSCLRKLSGSGERRRRWSWVAPVAQCLLGLLIAWFAFVMLGRALADVPDSFHENVLWKSNWWEKE